jgi:hypothetical protein
MGRSCPGRWAAWPQAGGAGLERCAGERQRLRWASGSGSGGAVRRWAGEGAGAGACVGAGRGAGERRWGTGGGERLAAAQTWASPGCGDCDGAALAAQELKARQCLALGGLSQKVQAPPEVSARLTAMAQERSSGLAVPRRGDSARTRTGEAVEPRVEDVGDH